jgi:diaminobutyrate-2-oxoglutarate transaminase
LHRENEVRQFLDTQIQPLHAQIAIRGAGLIWGIDVAAAGGPALAKQVAQKCFEKRLIIERAGRDDTVLKIMPPLIIEAALLLQGLAIVRDALREVLSEVLSGSLPADLSLQRPDLHGVAA